MSGREAHVAKAAGHTGKDQARAPLANRFYKDVSVASAEPEPGYRVLLDGRPVRTPKKLPLIVPTRALADVIAAEWATQTEKINPATMPLTKLAITAIDAVRGASEEVAGDIVKYAGSDLLCYRAEGPDGLARKQAEAWDALIDWSEEELGARLQLAQGVMPIEQGDTALECVGEAVAPYDEWALTGLHMMTTLTGSAVLALAHAKGRLTAEEAWAAAHVDEDWQSSQWGDDAEEMARRERRWAEMQAASRFLELLRRN